jgi:hypothetical protein
MTTRLKGEELAKAIAERIRKETRLQEKTAALEQILELTHPDAVFRPDYDAELYLNRIERLAKQALGRDQES